MRISRRLLASGFVQAPLAFLLALYIRIVGGTTRWQREGFDTLETLRAEGKPLIFCFWHGRLAMMPLCHREARAAAVLISIHRDGRLVARVIERLGLSTIDGSTGRGGETAMLQCRAQLSKGGIVSIAPDGPRGPRMQAAAGTIQLAALTGVPILPSAVATSRRHVFSSWDRFLLPLPFGRGLYRVGAPISVPRDADASAIDAARLALERALNELSADCDRRMGHAPIEPAPSLATMEAAR
jgi:lysophospholipid acyltransferase (LPLAT)-like uncharacterized protein